MNPLKTSILVLTLLFMVTCLPSPAGADWLKLDLPPDADKEYGSDDATCWLATAANMLAGAGYGYSSPDTTSVQGRADYIYEQLKDHYGTDT